MKKVVIIGSGFAGLSAACFMAKAGWSVTVIEKHPGPGGRARQFQAADFTFDMGPSWYWMPDVFERFLASLKKNHPIIINLKDWILLTECIGQKVQRTYPQHIISLKIYLITLNLAAVTSLIFL